MKVMDLLQEIANSGLSLDRELKFCKKSEQPEDGSNDKNVIEVDASVHDYVLLIIED